jgi:tRNA uridine 5-carboxymethylaminomethyl modification enzyme
LTAIWPELGRLPAAIAEQIEIDARYAGYLERQQADIVTLRKDEALEIPADLDYTRVGGLSNEVRGKLLQVRPATLAAAARIPGITPAALTALLGYVKRGEARKTA